MNKQQIVSGLDSAKLRENSLTSIRLGIEDFEKSQLLDEQGGDPARALSAVRNLFAGVLLLFKYKIAVSANNSKDAASLIFNPPEILPQADGTGGIEWTPIGNFKKTTIDVDTIKKRFEGFGIEVDWSVIKRLQDCRNHLEHLHPANTLGEVAGFVAELFPVLRDFIQAQMNEQPADLLGASWELMLSHHHFFADTRTKCAEAWAGTGVPERMYPWLGVCKCENCGSPLITPSQEDIDNGSSVEYQEDHYTYTCLACGHRELIVPLIIESLNETFYYDPRDGDEPRIETCYSCDHETFMIYEQECLWCDAELDCTECSVCEERLGQEDQDNDGGCSYHAHVYERVMRE